MRSGFLGHKVGGRGAAYDRGRRLARLRPIANLWGARLAAIVGGDAGRGGGAGAGGPAMSLDVDTLRRRLSRVLEKQRSAATSDVALGCFVDEKGADERRLLDNAWAGRLEWRATHNRARYGLEAVAALDAAREALLAAIEAEDDDGIDRETAAIEVGLAVAEAALGEAEGLFVAALEAKVTPREIADLGKSAKERGRHRSEINRLLDQTVERVAARNRRRGWLTTALHAALAADPALAQHFLGASNSRLEAAYKSGKKV